MNIRLHHVLGFLLLLSLPPTLHGADASEAAANPPTGPSATPPTAQPLVVSPAPTASADTAPAPPTPMPAANPTTYALQPGDSLDSVAHKFNTSIHALVKLNHIKKSEYKKLRTGRVLQIPPASTDTTAK